MYVFVGQTRHTVRPQGRPRARHLDILEPGGRRSRLEPTGPGVRWRARTLRPMVEIPEAAAHLFENKDFAHVSTLNKNGSPQVSAVWIALEDDLVVFNTTRGYLKARNMERDGRVSISIIGQENPYETLVIQGTVVEMTADDADPHMDALTKRYMGIDEYPYRSPGEERLIVRIRPEKVRYDSY
jgi:PPOX class probable F420-dependent enzyme